MATFTTDEEILSAFNASDPKLWLREHQVGLTRRACYFYEAPVSASNDMLVRHEILITHKTPFSPTARSEIEVSSYAITGGPRFPLFSTCLEVDISPFDQPVEKCSWSNMEDELVKKAYDVSLVAGAFIPGKRSIT